MGSVTAIWPASAGTGHYLGPATVAWVADRCVGVVLANAPTRVALEARIALPEGGPLAAGDEVLAIGDPDEALYVVGRLSAPRPAGTTDQDGASSRLPLPGGGLAALETLDGSTRLRIYSPDAVLVLEHDPLAGKTRVTPEAGDLELTAPAGDLVLRAAGRVGIEGDAVSVRARGRIALAIESGTGATNAAAALEDGGLQIAAPALEVAARQARFRVEDTRCTGRTLLAELGSLRLVAGRVETLARTLVERAQDLYRAVDGLLETKAGRVRSLVDGTYHLQARDAVVRAERDVDVDGEKIRLG